MSLFVFVLGACASDDDDTPHGDDAPAETTDAESDAPTAEAPELCQAYVDHLVDCSGASDFAAANAYGDCSAQLGAATNQGGTCEAAYEEYFACMSGASCGVLEDPSMACPDERSAAEAVCAGGESSTGDGTSGGG